MMSDLKHCLKHVEKLTQKAHLKGSYILFIFLRYDYYPGMSEGTKIYRIKFYRFHGKYFIDCASGIFDLCLEIVFKSQFRGLLKKKSGITNKKSERNPENLENCKKRKKNLIKVKRSYVIVILVFQITNLKIVIYHNIKVGDFWDFAQKNTNFGDLRCFGILPRDLVF